MHMCVRSPQDSNRNISTDFHANIGTSEVLNGRPAMHFTVAHQLQSSNYQSPQKSQICCSSIHAQFLPTATLNLHARLEVTIRTTTHLRNRGQFASLSPSSSIFGRGVFAGLGKSPSLLSRSIYSGAAIPDPGESVMNSQKIKLAILDDYQRVAWPLFQEFRKNHPELEVAEFPETLRSFSHGETSEEERMKLVDRLKPFTIISTMRERTPFPADLVKQLPNLKLLLTTAPRNAAIDIKACTSQGIVVAGTTGAGSAKMERRKKKENSDGGSQPSIAKLFSATTQHTLALLLGIAGRVAQDDAAVKNGAWQSGLMTALAGKTLALVGLGRLGIQVGKIGRIAFGMNVIAWSSSLTQEAADEKARTAGLPVDDETGGKTFRVVSKEDLFRYADFVSVHYVLSERSKGVVEAKDLALMKPTSILVNTSRGPLIDEQALLKVLKAGKIRGAALDVFDIEPLPQDSPWRTTKWGKAGSSQVLLSPHMGYVEEDLIENFYEETVDNVERYLEGKDVINIIA